MTKEELIKCLTDRFGETPTDDDVKLLENFSDFVSQFDDVDNKLKEADTKYDELKARYIARFSEGSPSKKNDTETNNDNDGDDETDDAPSLDDVINALKA